MPQGSEMFRPPVPGAERGGKLGIGTPRVNGNLRVPKALARAIGWSGVMWSGFDDEAQSFGRMFVIVDEGLVERLVASGLDDGEDRVAQ